MNDQSSFHWTEFLVYFFYLFHLEKTEFTLEMLTHARLSKVLACVALKKRRSFSSFFSLFLDLDSVDSGRDFQQSLPRSWSWCILFVFYASVLPVLLWDVEDLWSKGVLFLERLGGWEEEWRISSHSLCYLDCMVRVQGKPGLSHPDCGHSLILL